MARYHTTQSGNVAFSSEEETARDAEEKAWADGKSSRDWLAIRNRRNTLLAETDWWGNSDLTMSDAQKKYRTDLRDLPSTVSDASKWEDINWPTKPS